jgi:CRISPR/Cas system-associated endonuclease Cas1
MSWRTVVITKTSKLDYSMGHLVVIDNDLCGFY